MIDFAETKCKKARKCEQDTVTHNSKNAYMLVYSKIGNCKFFLFNSVSFFLINVNILLHY